MLDLLAISRMLCSGGACGFASRWPRPLEQPFEPSLALAITCFFRTSLALALTGYFRDFSGGLARLGWPQEAVQAVARSKAEVRQPGTQAEAALHCAAAPGSQAR